MEEVTTTTQSNKKKSPFKMVLFLLVVVIALAGYAGAYYFYDQYQKTKIVLDNPEIASQNEVKEITSKLGKIYEIPQDEEPTVATVLDKEKLADQPFFSKAENGDKVIIYTKTQLAILYRVEANKIISVAPVSLQEPQGTDATTETVSPTTKPVVAPTTETEE